MREFKFACPVCGQHIKCDAEQSGTTLECPTCFQKVVVPQAPASDDPKFILTGTKVSDRSTPFMAAAANSKTASPPKKSLVAPVLFTAFVLVCAGMAVVFALREKASKPTDLTARTEAPGETNESESMAETNIEISVSDTNWMLNLDTMAFPDTAVSGRIHGKAFVPQRANLELGTLTLRMPGRGPVTAGFSIYLHATRSADLARQSVNITSDFTNAPVVRLRWLDDQQQPKTQDFKDGYALRIEFGQLAGNRLVGKMYLCIPDEQKSYVVGTFNAEIRRPRPPKPKT